MIFLWWLRIMSEILCLTDCLTPFRMSVTPDLLPAVCRWIQRGRLFPGQQESPEDLSVA